MVPMPDTQAPTRRPARPRQAEHMSPFGATPVAADETAENDRVAGQRRAPWQLDQRMKEQEQARTETDSSVRMRLRRYRLAALVALLIVVVALAPAAAGIVYAGLLDSVSSVWSFLPRSSLGGDSPPEAGIVAPEPELQATEGMASEIELAAEDGAGWMAAAGGFIASTVSSLREMLAGPLLDSGDRIIIADLESGGGLDPLVGHAVALAIEEDLTQSTYFTVMQRERSRIALAGEDARNLQFSVTQAVVLAASSELPAVIAGSIAEDEGVYTLQIVITGPDGVELYQFNVSGVLDDVVTDAVRRLRRRLGASDDAGQSTLPVADMFHLSSPALASYARARGHLFDGDFKRAILAAGAAVTSDTSFALAYRLRAEAYALSGQRRRAKDALEEAWRFRQRLSERERLRLAADRQAFAGNYEAAILGYERLFKRYRDDVSALKSQAIAQQIVGTRGGGLGNLELARSLDPADWPPLERTAKFLGYRGRLPAGR